MKNAKSQGKSTVGADSASAFLKREEDLQRRRIYRLTYGSDGVPRHTATPRTRAPAHRRALVYRRHATPRHCLP